MQVSIPVLALAVALAGVAGVRAFIPLFFLCHALRLDLISAQEVNPFFVPFLREAESPSTFIWLGVLAAIEVVVMKSRRLSTDLDLPFLILRLLSAVLAAFAVLPFEDVGTALTAAIVLGAIGAIPIMNLQATQTVDEQGRVPGYVHYTSSTLIDGIALGACSIALQMPYLGLGFLHAAMWATTVGVSRWRRRTVDRIALTQMAPAPEMPEDYKTGRLDSEEVGPRRASPDIPDRVPRRPRTPGL